jgi:hypothetical protein
VPKVGTFCRKCGATEDLRTVFVTTYCGACAPVRHCKECGLPRPDVTFRNAKAKFCLTCERARLAARKKRRSGKPKPEHSDQAAKRGRSHLNWIRLMPCCVNAPECRGIRMHAHHVRRNTGGGTALLPDACWAVPLCARHHLEGHHCGWITFESKYGLNLRERAEEFAAASPYLHLTTPSVSLTLHNPLGESP